MSKKTETTPTGSADENAQAGDAAPTTTKVPRARWSEPQIVRLSAGKSPDSAALCLLKALAALNLAHGTVDTILGVEAGTTMKFLRTDSEQPGLTADSIDRLLVLLVELHGEGAFTPRGLDTALTLRVMMRVSVEPSPGVTT